MVARGPERLLASDEGGELAAARQSAIHNCTMTGSYLADCRSSSAVVARGPERLLASDGGRLNSAAATDQSALWRAAIRRESDSAAECVSRLDYSRIHVRL